MGLLRDSVNIIKVQGMAGYLRAIPRYLCWHPPFDQLRWRISCLFMPRRPILRNILGKPMMIEPWLGGIHKELYLYGCREAECTEIFSRWIPEGAVVADIGANIGYYTLIEADRAKKVYALEPSPQNIRLLKENIALNGCESRVEVHEVTISNTSGRALFSTSEVPNHHRLLAVSEQKPASVIEVQTATLDEFMGQQDVDVIRMDLEGTEWLVLQGMKDILSRKRPLRLFMEVHTKRIEAYGGDARAMFALLFAQGFRVTGIVLFGYKQGYGRAFPRWFAAPYCPHQYVCDIDLSAVEQSKDNRLRQLIEDEDTYSIFMER